jgi:hypothetical protein
MSEWISMTKTAGKDGFLLQLRFDGDVNKAEIRLLEDDVEVARGTAIASMEQHYVTGVEPATYRQRPFDLHEDEMDWIAAKLGVERVAADPVGIAE